MCSYTSMYTCAHVFTCLLYTYMLRYTESYEWRDEKEQGMKKRDKNIDLSCTRAKNPHHPLVKSQLYFWYRCFFEWRTTLGPFPLRKSGCWESWEKRNPCQELSERSFIMRIIIRILRHPLYKQSRKIRRETYALDQKFLQMFTTDVMLPIVFFRWEAK